MYARGFCAKMGIKVRKASRTISGVTPVAVMAEPMSCPGVCVYCPSSSGAPKSYTVESPAVLRAARCDFEAGKQVAFRLETLAEMGHPCDKVELIVMGGTFLAAPEDYQYRFIKDCYDALNGVPARDLAEARSINEQTEHRCVGLCIETRPDWCGEREVERMLEFGATRVELGVQALDDDIYRLVRRGHGIDAVVCATRLLRDRGFKVYYHWMPGLPGSTTGHDLEMSRQLFTKEAFRPDGLKLYPTLVVEGSDLKQWYQDGHYLPYSDEEMIDLLAEIKGLLPPYVRVSRLMRDIPTKFILAGSQDLALRETVRKRMAERGMRCRCIRCREYGHRLRKGWSMGEFRLTRREYRTEGGQEIFLAYEDEHETLAGLLRLRIKDGSRSGERAIVRELHVFGSEVPLGEQQEQAAQHRGWGGELLGEAERIVREEFHADKLNVLSGVGAREYYRLSGYELQGNYMVKGVGGDG